VADGLDNAGKHEGLVNKKRKGGLF